MMITPWISKKLLKKHRLLLGARSGACLGGDSGFNLLLSFGTITHAEFYRPCRFLSATAAPLISKKNT